MNQVFLFFAIMSVIASADVDYPKACRTGSVTKDVDGAASVECERIADQHTCNAKMVRSKQRCNCVRTTGTWPCQKSSVTADGNLRCSWNVGQNKCQVQGVSADVLQGFCRAGQTDVCNNTYVPPPPPSGGGPSVSPSPPPGSGGGTGSGSTPDPRTICFNMRATNAKYPGDCSSDGDRLSYEWSCWTPSYPNMCKPEWNRDGATCRAASPNPDLIRFNVIFDKGRSPSCIPK